jgi:hypothetical protein
MLGSSLLHSWHFIGKDPVCSASDKQHLKSASDFATVYMDMSAYPSGKSRRHCLSKITVFFWGNLRDEP